MQRVQLPRTADDWHATDSIFKDMGGVKGRLIAHLTMDDVHYTWKLLEAGANVLVVSPSATLLKDIEAKKAGLKLPDGQLRTRLAPADSVGLHPAEVDAVLFTRTFSQVRERRTFFTRLRQATNGYHQVTLVEFLQQQTPMGPPLAQRMDPEAIMDELGNCGFGDVMALSKQIPYRAVIVAQDFVEIPGQ
ncbi:MAG: hypothetical protein QM724_08035 [Flavobacteriales bacterium]